MPSTFVVVPQWQGSGSSRAMRLIDGAEAIAGDLPAASTRRVEVPLEAGDDQGSGIHRLSSLQLVRERVEETVAAVDGPVITVGGDCGVEWGAIGRYAGDETVALVWFDAHPDLNTPDSSPSGAFGGMVLRRLVDDGFDPRRVVLAGTRAFDPEEERAIAEWGVPLLGVSDLQSPDALLAAVEQTGAERVYIHVDLDVLDPPEFAGAADPQPFGVSPGGLVAIIRALTARFPLVSGGVAGFSPVSPAAAEDDLPSILRVLGALSAGG